jgi:FAD:protein FMN transferase
MNHTSEIHQFNHRAMATNFQVRIAGQEEMYAAQAALAALDVSDELEDRLSRFRPNSEIAKIGHLAPGEKMRLSQPAFACLQIAMRIEEATQSAFSATSAALKCQHSVPRWELLPDEHSIVCVSGLRSGLHGRVAPRVGLSLIFAGCGWQQHPCWRSASQYSRLVLRSW